MKEYLLLAKGNRATWEAMSDQEWDPILKGFDRWISQMKKDGLWGRGARLSGLRSTIPAQDGPFAETKEAVTGFFTFLAEDLDHARKLALGCPALLHDSLELYEMEGDR